MEIIKNENIRRIIKAIENAGGKVYIAGGFVRDMLLKIDSKDIDFEVYELTVTELGNVLYNTKKNRTVGKSFEVFKFYERNEKREYDFSIPKKRVFIKNMETGKEELSFVDEPFLKEEESCRRRDLTINAMLYDIKNDEIVDYFGGINDVKNRILRVVDEKAFQEDPLRILRTAQFAARFNFNVEEKTERIAVELKNEVRKIPKERIFYEIEKILMKAEKPSIAFRWMKKIGILSILLPEIEALTTVKDGEKYHGEENVFEHTMMTLDCVPIEKRTTDIMIAALYHDIGKLNTQICVDEKEIHFYGHEKKGFEAFAQYILKLTDKKEVIHEAGRLILNHAAPINMADGVTRKQIRKLASKVDIEKLMILHEADVMGRVNKIDDREYISDVLKIYREIKNEIKPLIKGRDLIKIGIEPSLKMGEMLKEIYEAQLNEKFSTYEEGINYVKDKIK